MNNTIKLETWVRSNDIYALKHSEHAHRLRKQAEDREYNEYSRRLAELVQASGAPVDLAKVEHWQDSHGDDLAWIKNE
jgi:hypothetical protein